MGVRIFAETDKDIENVEAWAEVVADLLHHVPPDKRADVLELATKNEQAEALEREVNGEIMFGITFVNFGRLDEPGQRHWNAIERLKSLLVQIFVRDITNNNSRQDAARILFVHHRHGTGSRLLEDYLPDQK
jgi:hypothetical protein